MKQTKASLVQGGVLFAGLGAFVAVFGAYGFIAPWGGDIHVYIATVHSLYRDMWNPSDVNLDVESTNAYFFSPYLVPVALAGKAFGITPYRALEFAGVFNVALYAVAIAVFCRTYSAIPRSPWPPLFFLAVSLFLRTQAYAWSSETSYLTLGIIQAYPSLLGWALALFSFVVMKHAAEKRSALPVTGLSLLIALLIRIHPITATWTIGIAGLRALYLAVPPVWRLRRERALANLSLSTLAPALALLAAIALGIALSFAWPYSSPIVLFLYGGVQEHDTFGSDPFAGIPAVYVLAIVGLALSRHRRIYGFWVLAFIATFGALELLRSVGITFADRYVFFMGFFAQFVVADCLAVVVTQLFSMAQRRERRSHGAITATAIYLLLFAAAVQYYAPIVRAPIRGGILDLRSWRESQSAERAYYDQWAPLQAVLHPGEIAMMPASWDAGLDIPAVTGAKIVAAVLMVGVPDSTERARSVEQFFTPGQTTDVRVRELKRWNATKVILTPPALGLATEMQAFLGPPVWRDQTRIVFTVPPERLVVQ